MTQEELNALVNEFYEYLANQKDFYEVWPSEDDTICVDVDWGDWKHDHLRLDHVAREFFENKGYDVLNMNTEVTDEDGSDTYSATHSYRLRKHVEEPKEYKMVDSNSVKVEEESLEGSSNTVYSYICTPKDGNKKKFKTFNNKEDAIKFVKNNSEYDAIREIISLVHDGIKEIASEKWIDIDESCNKKDKKSLKEKVLNKGEKIAQIIAKAFKGECGPFGGENPYLDGNKVTFHSQGPNESWIFNDDGSVDFDETEDEFVEVSNLDDYGCDSEEELRDYFNEIKHFDSVKDLFNSGLSWFIEVPNEEELLRKINNVLNESLKEDVESKVRLENARLVSWPEYYLNDVCDGDEDQYNELYADSMDDFGDEPCQFFFDVLDDKDNYLGKIGIYLFEGMGMWYEIGFEPNAKYLDIEKLDLEDMDLPVDGWFPEEHVVKNDDDLLKTEEQAREYLVPYLAKIENAIEYSNDDLED